MSSFKDNNFENLGKRYVYNLTAILSHNATKESSYSAVVHKRVPDSKEKQWFVFSKDKMEIVTEKQALKKYPA